MKKIFLTLVLLSIVFIKYSYNQEISSEDKIEKELKKIYESIEYKTIPQKGHYESWLICENKLIREIFVKLSNRNALMMSDGKVVDLEKDNAKLLEDIYEGNVRIYCQKRYYDDQLSEIRFINTINPKNVPLPLKDWIYLEDLLENYYQVIKDKNYSYTNLTKTSFDSKQKYNIDILINGLNPNFMIWNNIGGDINTNSYHIVSAFGRMGYDQLVLPFWYKGGIIGGINYEYIDKMEKADRDYKLYSIYCGIDEPLEFSVATKNNTKNELFKDRLLKGLGSNVIFGGSYTMNLQTTDYKDLGKYLIVGFEASVNMQQRNKFYFPTQQFYAVKNILSFNSKIRHADLGFASVNGKGLFNYGLNLSWYSSQQYSTITNEDKLRKLGSINSNGVISPQFGIAQDGDFLQYSLELNYNYNFSTELNPYGFIGIKMSVMLNNFIGIDLRYFKAVQNSKNLPPWHYDNYIVLSPVLRFNY